MKRTAPKKSSTVHRKPAFTASEQRAVVNNSATSWFWTSPRMRALLGDELREPMAQHPWIFAAIDRIGTNIAGVPWTIRTGDRKSPTLVESGPWVDLFDKGIRYAQMPDWDIADFWKAWVMHRRLSGEVFVLKFKNGELVRTEKDAPDELMPVSGELLEERFRELALKENGAALKQFVGWRYKDPFTGAQKDVEFFQVVHSKYVPDPVRPWRGLAPLKALMVDAKSDYNAVQFNQAFFREGCVVSGVVEVPGALTEDQVKEIKQQKQDDHAGADKAFRLLVLHSGMKFVPMQTLHKDMAFIEQLGMNRDRILAVLGVPKGELGLDADGNGGIMTGEATASGDKNFWTKTLLPEMRAAREAFYRQMFRPVDDRTWGEFDETQIAALKPDRKMQLELLKEAMAHGVTFNEANEWLDLKLPAQGEDGNTRWITSGLSPMDTALEPPAPEEPAADLSPDDGEAPEDADEMPIDEPEMEAEAKIVKANVHTWKVLAGRDPNPEERAGIAETVSTFIRARTKSDLSAWKGVVKALAPLESKFRSKVRRHVMDVRATTLKRLPRLMRALVQRDPPEEPFDQAKADANLMNLTRATYYEILNTAFDGVFEEMGGNFTFDQADPRVVEIVKARGAKLVKVNDTLRRQIRAVISEGVQNNATVQSIRESLRQVFNGATSRSLVIARTETASAANEARFVGMREEGVESARWISSNDEAVRESHREQDGEVRKLGEAFSNGCRWPGDPMAPANETINCRCVCAPE